MSDLVRFNQNGLIYFCEDYVNTDVMAPGRFDPIYEDSKLAKIALIDYRGIEPFSDPILGRSRFSFIVAGKDFGCGSSRETAPMAIAAAGVSVIVAKSFARIFYRNCINMGKILPIQLDHNFDSKIHGQKAVLDMSEGIIQLGNESFSLPSFGVLTDILSAGGLSQFVKAGGFE